MNRDQFNRDIRPLWEMYRNDNAWVGNWRPSWNDDRVMQEFTTAAYRLYQVTSLNELRLVLLGGTGIRLNKHLISNFGVTGVSGIQETETEDLAGAEQRLRTEGRSRPSAPGLQVPVYAVGSILSEDKWTPLLNDALIVGSAVANQEFQLALEPGSLSSWDNSLQPATMACRAEVEEELNRLQTTKGLVNILSNHNRHNPVAGASPANVKVRNELGQKFSNQVNAFHHGGAREYYEEVWKIFLSENLHLLWDTNYGIPRVLARELIGLFHFGYKPEFNNMTLGFAKSRNAPQPNFADYVKKLRRLGMHGSSGRMIVMKHLSKCLFDDETALCFPEDRSLAGGVTETRKKYLGGTGYVPQPNGR